MKLLQLFLIICVTGTNVTLSDVSAGVTYCVRSTESPACHYKGCRMCASWYHYASYVINNEINHQANVTIIFMNGHYQTDYLVEVTSPTIRLIGESHKATIEYANIFFMDNNQVTIMSLSFKSTYVRVSPTLPIVIRVRFESIKLHYSEVYAYIEGVNAEVLMQFNECNFYDGMLFFRDMKVNFTDCDLNNSTMIAGGVAIKFAGVSKVRNAWTSAITCYFCPIQLQGNISFVNNSAVRGGAMALHTSTLYIDANSNITFANNTAKDRGGAIFTVPNLQPYPLDNTYVKSVCFYQTLNCNKSVYYNVYFRNNFAMNGGDDIYGSTTETYCFKLDQECNVSMFHESHEGLSSISSSPTRICLCDDRNVPQCQNRSYIHKTYKVCPGETFTVSAVVVGGAFATTVGTVYAGVLSPKQYVLRPTSQYGQAIESKHCTILNYTMYSNHTNDATVMYLSSMQMTDVRDIMFYANYEYYTPVFINITILPCPPGFVLTKDPSRCGCNKVLILLNVECDITDGIGYMLWNGNLWVNVSNNETIYTSSCPFNYCTVVGKKIDMQRESDSQCAFNRAGRLCGGCKDGYSLAIGSSHCIHCPNNNNLALIIFFATSGFLLVVFIGGLNLTVSQGMINGLIFYVNVIWIYEPIFFPQQQQVVGLAQFLKTFIAWINLDFGIETCFASRLTAFWKMWLQFVFLVYILSINGLIVIAVRCSSKLTSFVGNRAISALSTLFLLSYMKIIRIVIAILNPSTLTEHSSGSHTTVWSEDGNLTYLGFPHVLLFIAGLAAMLFVWLPYTLLLLTKQCHLGLLLPSRLYHFIRRFHPFLDAHFEPLKPKHHYWFGVLLVVRGALLTCFASTLLAIPQDTNLLILFIVGVILLFHTTFTLPYKDWAVLLVTCSFLTNLVLISGFAIFSETYSSDYGKTKSVAVTLSTGFAFLKLCGIVIYEMIARRCAFKRNEVNNMMTTVILHRTNDEVTDSDEREPLLEK